MDPVTALVLGAIAAGGAYLYSKRDDGAGEMRAGMPQPESPYETSPADTSMPLPTEADPDEGAGGSSPPVAGGGPTVDRNMPEPEPEPEPKPPGEPRGRWRRPGIGGGRGGNVAIYGGARAGSGGARPNKRTAEDTGISHQERQERRGRGGRTPYL